MLSGAVDIGLVNLAIVRDFGDSFGPEGAEWWKSEGIVEIGEALTFHTLSMGGILLFAHCEQKALR